MSITNSERMLVRVLRQVAAERGISVEPISENWIFQLSYKGQVRHVYGYSFDLNTAATHQIACDKCATSQVLSAHGVAHIPHSLFLHPSMAKFVPHRGNWQYLLEQFASSGRDAVIKENTGTGGRGVLRVRNEVELESGVYALFARTTAVAFSPFCEAPTEVRFVMLDGHCELAFTKVRPTVIGDGTSSAFELLAARIASQGMTADLRRLLENLEEDAAHALAVIPPRSTEFLINWRHNLGQGAAVQLIDPPAINQGGPLRLATHAAKALNLVFGSVDVLLTAQGPKVLEVNAGVMMEFLSRGIPQGEEIAAGIYRRALAAMFR